MTIKDSTLLKDLGVIIDPGPYDYSIYNRHNPQEKHLIESSSELTYETCVHLFGHTFLHRVRRRNELPWPYDWRFPFNEFLFFVEMKIREIESRRNINDN